MYPALISVGFAALVALIGLLWRMERRMTKLETKAGGTCGSHQGFEGRLCEVEHDHARDGVKMEVMWKVIDPVIAGVLHSPVHVDRDALVDKLVANDLTDVEADTLIGLLEMAVDEEENPHKKLAAAFLLGRTEMLLEDREHERRKATRVAGGSDTRVHCGRVEGVTWDGHSRLT